jgi:hypothetical protein
MLLDNIFKEISREFPKATQIEVVVKGDGDQITEFTKRVREYVQTEGILMIPVEGVDPEAQVTRFQTPFGRLKLEKDA